jgi:hypothetical protein
MLEHAEDTDAGERDRERSERAQQIVRKRGCEIASDAKSASARGWFIDMSGSIEWMTARMAPRCAAIACPGRSPPSAHIHISGELVAARRSNR